MTRRSDEAELTQADLQRINTVLQQIGPVIDSQLRAAACGKPVPFFLLVWGSGEFHGVGNIPRAEVRCALNETIARLTGTEPPP